MNKKPLKLTASPGTGFSSYIHELRKKHEPRLTQKEAAERAGISVAYWNLLEKGQRAAPSEAIVKRIADALGIDSEELLNCVESDRSNPIPTPLLTWAWTCMTTDPANTEWAVLREQTTSPALQETLIGLYENVTGRRLLSPKPVRRPHLKPLSESGADESSLIKADDATLTSAARLLQVLNENGPEIFIELGKSPLQLQCTKPNSSRADAGDNESSKFE